MSFILEQRSLVEVFLKDNNSKATCLIFTHLIASKRCDLSFSKKIWWEVIVDFHYTANGT